jgi:hypothetical protein
MNEFKILQASLHLYQHYTHLKKLGFIPSHEEKNYIAKLDLKVSERVILLSIGCFRQPTKPESKMIGSGYGDVVDCPNGTTNS